MKNYLYVFLFWALLSACAKKTYIAESSSFSQKLKTNSDSSARKSSLITDKTVTITNRSIDTNIIVSGKALTGYLRPSNFLRKDTNAHFENEDINLFLSIDKNGKTTATAIPKSKTIKAKALEQTTIYNDITKNEELSKHAKSELAAEISSTVKHTQKQSSGNSPFGFSLAVVLVLALVFIWIGRKFLSLGKIFGNN